MKAMLTTFFISMVPVLELRGAIPAGIVAGLDPIPCAIAAIVGNMIPVPFIIVFGRKIFRWLENGSKMLRKFALYLKNKADGKKDQVLRYEFWGLMILVAIPVPGTGAWTGSLVAAMLDMQLKRALPAIFVGVVAAGIVVTLAACGVAALI